jgi:regulator of protease activity HflC (stomatin/prohibitin superfamily)
MVGTILSILFIIIVVFAALTVKIITQRQVGVVECLGKFHRIMHAGLNILVPIIDRVRIYHNLRIQQTNVPPQKVITRL